MKNYLRHNFQSHYYTSGKPRISLLGPGSQNITCSSDFVSPLRNIIAGCFSDKYQRFGAGIKVINEKEKKKSGWLNNFFWNHNPVNILKRDLLESEYEALKDSCNAFGSNLKKYFSQRNIFDKNDIAYKKENHKSAENIGHNSCNNSEVPSEKLQLPKKLNLFVPNMTKCSNHIPISRSHSNPYLRNDFLRNLNLKCNELTVSRSLTTLRSKSESAKTIVSNPSNLSRNRSTVNTVLLANRRQSASKTAAKDSANVLVKLKKKDFDWINSFSSEAVILQPSRGEFSIKKLVNKTTCQERLWGLPPKQSYARTLGPRMNDNLIQYMALKHKMQPEQKKNNFIGEGLATNYKVKKLIKAAKEKNMQFELEKMKKISAKSTTKNMLRTIKDSINLKPIDILQRKEKTTKNNKARNLQKAYKKSSILNFRLPNIQEKQKNLLQKEKPINKPSATEYQSSASYQHVFQELFSKASKTRLPSKSQLALTFSNRQACHNFSRSAGKPNIVSTENPVRKEKVSNKKEQSSTMLERNSTVNLKNQARTPFQKPSNTQLTRNSKASFSTVSKISKMAESSAINHSKPLKKTKCKISSPKDTSKRSISTNRIGNEGNKPVIKKKLYSTLGYYPAIPRRINMKPKKKLQNIKNKSIKPRKKEANTKNKSHTQSANTNSGFFNQRRSLSSFGVLIGNMGDTDISDKALTEPLNEQIFKEVMSLCKGQQPTDKKVLSSEKEKALKRYGKCSVEEKKKPERRRGFVCRIASMLNLGCGRKRRRNQGCSECGKKAG